MSWTDAFPFLTDEMVEEFAEKASGEDKAELEEFHGVAEVIKPRDKPQVVSCSLFWKNVRTSDPNLPEPTAERMKRARELGLAPRHDPWEHYVIPLLREAPILREKMPDVAFRVHLAKDLAFLIPDLVTAGCEVALMKGSSVRMAPGALWRYLPLEMEGKHVTVMDVERIPIIEADLARTRTMAEAGLGCWRVPQTEDFSPNGQVRYTPFFGDRFGARGGLPVRLLLDAFTWHCRRGTMNSTVLCPGKGRIRAAQADWPDYGFDEWFLTAALYPRIAATGLLTLVPASARSLFLPVDIEFVTWANADSQLVYYHE